MTQLDFSVADIFLLTVPPSLFVLYRSNFRHSRKYLSWKYVCHVWNKTRNVLFEVAMNYSTYCSCSEFQPGVPWKGIPNIDPESDPYVTPGSVLGGTATSPIVDTDHQLLRDNTTGLFFTSPKFAFKMWCCFCCHCHKEICAWQLLWVI